MRSAPIEFNRVLPRGYKHYRGGSSRVVVSVSFTHPTTAKYSRLPLIVHLIINRYFPHCRFELVITNNGHASLSGVVVSDPSAVSGTPVLLRYNTIAAGTGCHPSSLPYI